MSDCGITSPNIKGKKYTKFIPGITEKRANKKIFNSYIDLERYQLSSKILVNNRYQRVP